MFRYIQIEGLVKYLSLEGFHVKDVGLLASALDRPAASIFGADVYATLALKAAAQTQSIIKNHPMVDGNKRSAWFALNTFLVMNGFVLRSTQGDAFDFLMAVVTDLLSLEDMAVWIESRSIKI